MMDFCPDFDKFKHSPWKFTRHDLQFIDRNSGFVFCIAHMKVGGFMVIEIHSNKDAIKAADRRQMLSPEGGNILKFTLI